MTKAGLGGRESDKGRTYYCWFTGGITTTNGVATAMNLPSDVPKMQSLLHAEILVVTEAAPPTFARTELTIVAVTPTGDGEIQMTDSDSVSIFLAAGLTVSDFLILGYRLAKQIMA